MATNPVYRQTWTKHNGWQVRCDIKVVGGDNANYGTRTVVPMTGVFLEVSEQENSFDKICAGLAESPSCKFIVNYSNAHADIKSAIDSQYATLFSINVPKLLVTIFSDRGTSGATWYAEYTGCNVLKSEQEYKDVNGDLIVEIETLSLHKIILEIANISQSYLFELVRDAAIADSASPIVNSDYIRYYKVSSGTMDYIVNLKKVDGVFQVMAKLKYLFNGLDNFYNLIQHLIVGNAAASTTGVTYAMLAEIPYKFYKQIVSTSNIGGQGTQVAVTDLYFCVGETSSTDYTVQPNLDGLLASNGDNGITVNAKTYWELLKVLCEQFFVKAIPMLSYSGNVLNSYFTYTQPYKSTITNGAYNYNSNSGDEIAFKRNAERLAKSKIHVNCSDVDTEIYEEYIAGLSDSGYEITGVFNVDIPTKYVATMQWGDFNNRLDINYMNFGGLFYYESSLFYAVSPRIDFKQTDAIGYVSDTLAYFDIWVGRAAGLQIGISLPDLAHVENVRAIQNRSCGLRRTVTAILNLFGRGDNQTQYTITLPLSTAITFDKLGQGFDITPHAEMVGIIEEQSYMVSNKINWQSKQPSDDFVECVFLTETN